MGGGVSHAMTMIFKKRMVIVTLPFLHLITAKMMIPTKNIIVVVIVPTP